MPTDSRELTPRSIGQIAINVQDVGRATAFYRDTLGLRLLFEFPGLAFFDCGGVRLMLAKPEKAELDHAASLIYYKVDDIHAAHAALAARGVTIENAPAVVAKMPDHDLWISAFRDTENNILALMCEVPTGDPTRREAQV